MKSNDLLNDLDKQMQEARKAMQDANRSLKTDPKLQRQISALLGSFDAGNFNSAQAIADNTMVFLNNRLKEMEDVKSSK